MFKSFINFLEIGKDKSVHWFVRCQDVFLGLFFTVGGLLLICLSVIALLSGNIASSVVLGITALFGFVSYIIAWKNGKYETGFSWLACVGFVVATFSLLLAGDVITSGIFCVMFPLTISFLFRVNRGSYITIILIALYMGLGFYLGYSPSTLITVGILTIFFMFIVKMFLINTEDIKVASDHKISDIQKETEIKNEIISQLSYQIRTPLNNIVVIGGLLNETNLNQRQRDWMETIIASISTIVNVVNYHASKITSTGIVDPTKHANITFNLQAVMNNTIQLFVGQSNEYNIGLKPNMEEPYILEGDPIQIKQIFLTLIDAIIKNKTAEKINIIISYRVRQETEKLFDVKFEIRVSDHLVFDMECGDPNILNFSIASKLIEMSGSLLSVNYIQNNTLFNFTLSFNKGEEPKEGSDKFPEKIEPETTTPSFTSKSTIDLKEANVLLVEDNLINQKIVILSIQKLVKKIDIANNGQEAVDKFKADKYDVILMDIQMPIMDGIQATKIIRETELENRIIPTPIIAITANALAGDREHCLASGMDEYVPKPVDFKDLENKMKNLLASGSTIKH